ncbi:hypothetical protein PIIN_05913 [Serendipita indica DSM 11827]|uniref:Uncharacterized protein n=1 Tax=Serendipita indica (strain DSM 11827) TaxID=1109443 RepID=G4TKY5_SERID|nr:hypothetical protein PIIN_05913 [Serendipita indica DSM 11827]
MSIWNPTPPVSLSPSNSVLSKYLERRSSFPWPDQSVLTIMYSGDVSKQQEVIADIDAYMLTKPPGFRSPLSTIAELLRLWVESTAQFHVVLEHAQDGENTLRHSQEMEKAKLTADGRRLAQENEALKDGLARQKARIVDLENEVVSLRKQPPLDVSVPPALRYPPPASPLSSPMQLSPSPLIDKPAAPVRPPPTPLITSPGKPAQPNTSNSTSLSLSAPSLRRKRSSNGPLGPRERNGPAVSAAARPPGAAPSAFLPKLDLFNATDSHSHLSMPTSTYDGLRRTSLPVFVTAQPSVSHSDVTHDSPAVSMPQLRKQQRSSQPSSWYLVDYPQQPLVDSNQSIHEADPSSRQHTSRRLPKQPTTGTVENVDIPPRPVRSQPPPVAVDPPTLSRKRALRRQSNRDIILNTDL